MGTSATYMLNEEARRLQKDASAAARAVPADPQTSLRLHFEQAQKTGADLLIYSRVLRSPRFDESFMMPDLVPWVEESVVRIRDDRVPPLRLQQLIQAGSPITGIYDLKKPFDQACGGEELLPAAIKQAIREYRYDMLQADLPLWQRLLFKYDSRRRKAFQQTLPVILPVIL